MSSHSKDMEKTQNSSATSADAMLSEIELVVHKIVDGTAMSFYTKVPKVELDEHDIAVEPQQNQPKDSSYDNSIMELNAVDVEVIEELEMFCADSDEIIANFKKRNAKKKKKKNKHSPEDGARDIPCQGPQPRPTELLDAGGYC
ncbi:uncharacterized protein [Coffea arabica]|uniref:Uncharacterized protein n=1 Tax=Coffea arabica TaxID=13443 RepID=A0A6P6TQG5_COFAR|nr:uncharacterized protein LOC113703248 [Coffea arabica]